eukprot:Tamp_20008.p3 GENE.Tamp_20008~~Tamp_20008.p3  ORF type:complete len:130 (-),score=13.47 Tamp_20008:543-932(-)
MGRERGRSSGQKGERREGGPGWRMRRGWTDGRKMHAPTPHILCVSLSRAHVCTHTELMKSIIQEIMHRMSMQMNQPSSISYRPSERFDLGQRDRVGGGGGGDPPSNVQPVSMQRHKQFCEVCVAAEMLR